jgi:signal transduction histidine kinase/ActR/RegA family two-component response regulator
LGLQGKMLAVVVGFLVLLPAATLWIVSRQLQRQMEDEALQTLGTAESVFRKSLENRTGSVLARYRSIVSEARVKVTADLADRKTIDGLLGALLEDSPDEHEAMFYLNENGELITGRRRSSSTNVEALARASAPVTSAALAGEPAPGYLAIDGRAYTVIAVPIFSPQRDRLLGVLGVGVRLADATLKDLALARTEILLMARDEVVVSTVSNRALHDAAVRDTTTAARHVVLAGEHFMARAGPIGAAREAQGALRYVMLASYEAQLRQLEDTRRTLLWLALTGIIISAGVMSWLVRRLIRPLEELSAAAEAVGRGDFSRRIERVSNDECGELAEAFNRMTGNLQTSRAELERAMQQVRTTQEQLIQSEKLSAVGQFVAGVAHELNNPLTAVVGFSELLRDMSGDEKTRSHVDRIAKSAHRCHKIVQSLLSFARQHAPERRLVDLRSVVDEVLEIMSYDLRTSNVGIVREFAPDTPLVMADPHQLQQVFVNILGNARQAIEPFQREGRIVVRIRRGGAGVQVEFQDNGPGIRPEHLARIFDPFFTTKPVGKGTGLGLSLCYGIVQEHGGKITARSELGQGAIFTIDLPVAQAPAPAATVNGTTLPLPAVRSSVSGKTILVIDDEAWILELAAELLRAEGHAVETAAGGQQAMALLAKRKFDAIVSDWKMPGLNGIRLYEYLQETDAATARRVLFMTGDVVSDTFQEFLRRNELTCLSKPFATAEFRAAVARIWDGIAA